MPIEANRQLKGKEEVTAPTASASREESAREHKGLKETAAYSRAVKWEREQGGKEGRKMAKRSPHHLHIKQKEILRLCILDVRTSGGEFLV